MPLPNLYFLAFEIIVLVLFLACLQNAWQRGSWIVWQLLAGVLFGLLLEWATIQQLDAYEYGHFLVMLGPVPVVIGVAWELLSTAFVLFPTALTFQCGLDPCLMV